MKKTISIDNHLLEPLVENKNIISQQPQQRCSSVKETQNIQSKINGISDLSQLKIKKSIEISIKKSDEKEEENQNQNKHPIKKYSLCGITIDLPLAALMIMNFFLNAACSVITPFFPPLATGQYKDAPLNLHLVQVGLVIGMHPLCGFFFGILMSKYLMNFGRRRVMVISLFITVITCVGMGLTWHLRKKQTAFFITNLICRGFMGMARSGYGSATFAYAPLLWPEKVDRVISMLESATGLGLMLGPIIGSGISEMFSFNPGLSYQMVFYLISGVFSLFIMPSFLMLPEEKQALKKQKTLKLTKVLTNMNIMSLFFQLTAAATSVTYMYPLWSDHLMTYGINNNISAIYLTSAALAYIIALQTLPHFIAHQTKKKQNENFRKFLGSSGILFCCILLLFMAPETTIGLPNSPWPLIVAIFLMGYAQALGILPYVPEQNLQVTKFYPSKDFEELKADTLVLVQEQLEDLRKETGQTYTQQDIHINTQEVIRKLCGDMAAGLFMASYSLGIFAGPTLGGFIFDSIEKTSSAKSHHCDKTKNLLKVEDPCAEQYAFQQLTRILLLFCFISFLLYLFFGNGYMGWRDTFCKPKSKSISIESNQDEKTNQTVPSNKEQSFQGEEFNYDIQHLLQSQESEHQDNVEDIVLNPPTGTLLDQVKSEQQMSVDSASARFIM